MSASKEKRVRAEQRTDGLDKKTSAAAEQAKASKKFKRNAIIAVIVIVLVVAAVIVINSNLFYTGTTAVKVGDTSYSAAEVSFFYRNTFNSIYSAYQSQYGDYASLFVDASTPLSEQQYSEDQTWADYVYEISLENMKQTTALYDEAMRNGYVLTEDDETEISNQINTMQLYANTYGYSSLNHFLATNYGKGMNEKLYKELVTKATIASSYTDKVTDGITYTDEQLKSYYAENADDLDYISYYYYLVSVSDSTFEDLDDEAKKTSAHEAAAAIAEAADGEAFTAAAKEFSETASVTLRTYQRSNLGAAYSDWLLDADRKAGDTTVIDSDVGSYALLFVERNNNDYPLVSMRHILLKTTDEDGNVDEELKASAEARIKEIYDEWKEDPTEDNFAALANEYSEDEGSNTTGGLYENIYRRTMVDSINDFLFNENAQVGDTKVVYGQSNSYEGYHLIYFVGADDEPYCDVIAKNNMLSSDIDDYIADLTSDYAISTGVGLKFADLD